MLEFSSYVMSISNVNHFTLNTGVTETTWLIRPAFGNFLNQVYNKLRKHKWINQETRSLFQIPINLVKFLATSDCRQYVAESQK